MAYYRIAPAATDDIERIWLFGLQQFGLTQADKYYGALFEHFEAQAKAPLSYPAVDHIRRGYRRSVCGAHSVFYRIHAEFIEVMRIVGKENF